MKLPCFFLTFLLLLIQSSLATESRPNIVVFYLDDMGWAQPGAYGGKLAPTPHMDRIAANGVRFLNGYSSGCVCSPGRVGLMTGRYQARTGHDANPTREGRELLLSEKTMAQHLKPAGYTTGIIGKWHLGASKPEFLPAARGFDFSIGSVGNLGEGKQPSFYRGSELFEDLEGAPVTSPVYAREACRFIDANKDKPFFLYLSFNAVHAPIVASPHWLAKFKGLPKREQAYAALVGEADDAIGTVMNKLRALKLEENTLVFCISDNGGASALAEQMDLRGRKWTVWEGGIRVTWLAQWKGKFPPNRVVSDPVIQLDVLPTALAACRQTSRVELDGVNLLPLLEGKADKLEPRALYFRFGVQHAVRQGDWKLVKAAKDMEPMLVNLANDPGEANDLSDKEPARKAELLALFDRWNQSMQPPRWQDDRWNGDPGRKASKRNSPNIVLILADDLGVGDLGCYRKESGIPTPHLDRLAKEGLRFTNAYCPASVCTPTRYGLLTGRYSWRSWKRAGVLLNWERPLIEDGIATIPGVLKDAGYLTAGLGKWHLGAAFATVDGKPPAGIGKNKVTDTGSNLDITKPVSGGPTDRGFEEWFGFSCASEQLILEENRVTGLLAHELYAPPTAKGVAQLPVFPLKGYLSEITRRGVLFLDAQRKAEKPFFLYFAPYVPHVPIIVEDRFAGASSAGAYGDYVHQLDDSVGKLLEALDRSGLAENTLVIFASDNGSEFKETANGHRPNAPFAGTKYTINEGGVRTPMIVRWPARIKAGATSAAICGLNDWMATLSALAGTEAPKSAVDSRSLLEILNGNLSAQVRESLALRSSKGANALRRGKWKLIPRSKDMTTACLYDLQADPTESHDLADQFPEIVKSMTAELADLLGKP